MPSSPRYELHGCSSPPRCAEAADVLRSSRCWIFRGVRGLDTVTDPLSTRWYRTDADVAAADLKSGEWILEECAVPAVRRQGPRTREDSTVHDHRPDPDERMQRARAGADADDLGGTNRRKNGSGELSLHSFLGQPIQGPYSIAKIR